MLQIKDFLGKNRYYSRCIFGCAKTISEVQTNLQYIVLFEA